MYKKAYGIIETLAPLHVGASAGEETGNLNLIFRDQFTQTGIIPGSSIRGRFRADLRLKRQKFLEQELADREVNIPDYFDGEDKAYTQLKWVEQKAQEHRIQVDTDLNERYWYGHEAVTGREDGGTTEAIVKFEYASLVWLPVFCPGQPIVWVTCPWLLKRYKQIAQKTEKIPDPYTASRGLQGRQIETTRKVLFFNLGFLEIEHEADLSAWIPVGTDLNQDHLVVMDNKDIGILHDMALYRQSRVKLLDEMKKVDTKTGAFFNVEALPEGSILVFPIALKETGWKPFGADASEELYFGGLESIGFGRCRVTLDGAYQ